MAVNSGQHVGLDATIEPPRELRRGRWRSAIVRSVSLTTSYFAGLALGQRQRESAAILMYHRVSNSPGHPTLNVAPSRFRDQLNALLERGYQAWPLSRLVDSHVRGESVPARVFAVTFDDGYACLFEEVLPILKELSVPATVFLATSTLDDDQPMSFDGWTLKGHSQMDRSAWLPLTTEQCQRMLQSGLVEIGSHTHTHQDFRRRAAALEADVRESVEVIRERFEIENPTFAFPYGVRHLGFCDEEMIQAVRAAGVSCALSTTPQLNPVETSPFQWGRIAVDQEDSPRALVSKLNGWYSALHRLYRRLRKLTGKRV